MKSSDQKVTRVNFPKMDANPQLVVLTLEEAKCLKDIVLKLHENLNPMRMFDYTPEEQEAWSNLIGRIYRVEEKECPT